MVSNNLREFVPDDSHPERMRAAAIYALFGACRIKGIDWRYGDFVSAFSSLPDATQRELITIARPLMVIALHSGSALDRVVESRVKAAAVARARPRALPAGWRVIDGGRR